MTMFDPRTKLSEQVVEEVRNYFGDLVYDVIIPRTVRLSEAPGYGQPITVYDPKSKGAECYRELAREVAVRPPPAEPMPAYEDLPTVVVPALTQEDTVTRKPLAESEIEEIPTVHAIEEELEQESAVATTEEAEDELEVEAVQEEVTEVLTEVIEDAEAEEREGVSEPAETTLDEPDEPAPATAAAEASEAAASIEVDLASQDDDLWEDVDEPAPPAPRVQPPHSPAPPGHLPERRVVVIDEDADYPASSTPRASEGHASDEEGADRASADIGATLEDEDGEPKRRWRLFRKGGE